MSKVTPLDAASNLRNIPHMLRNLASEYERGAQPTPRTIFVVEVLGHDEPPGLLQFGQEVGRLVETGALMAVAHRALQLDDG